MSLDKFAFPGTFSKWDVEDKEWRLTSNDGLTKLELISAIILNGFISSGQKTWKDAIEPSIILAQELLNKTKE